MALSDLQRLFVYYTATQIWQQDLLTNAYFQGSSVGANLRSMLLGQQPVQPLTNPFDEAMTGRLRADSASMRQNANNVREAASMVGIAAEAVGTIKSTLEEMQTLAQQIKNGDLTYSADLAAEYETLDNRITSIIEGTQYNGISLLNKAKWGTDQISSAGNVYVQSLPDGGFDVTFRDLSAVDWEGDLVGTDLGAAGTLQTQLDTLSGFIGDMDTLAETYSGRAAGLEYQATALESQADLLDQAVSARRQTPTKSLEEILLDLLLRDSGTIVDETG